MSTQTVDNMVTVGLSEIDSAGTLSELTILVAQSHLHLTNV